MRIVHQGLATHVKLLKVTAAGQQLTGVNVNGTYQTRHLLKVHLVHQTLLSIEQHAVRVVHQTHGIGWRISVKQLNAYVSAGHDTHKGLDPSGATLGVECNLVSLLDSCSLPEQLVLLYLCGQLAVGG